MRETSSKHNEPIRRHNETSKADLNLNINFLGQLVSAATDDASISNLNVKRKAREVPQERRRSKRTKTSRSSTTPSDDQNVHEHIEVQSYPSVNIWPNLKGLGDEVVPVLRHSFEIRYVKEDSAVDALTNEEEVLCDRIIPLSTSITSPRILNLGAVLLGECDDRVVCVAGGSDIWLMSVPSIEIDGDSNDFCDSPSTDLVKACKLLQGVGQVHLEGQLNMVVYPQEEQPTAFPTFSLHLELQISLVLPAAVENNIAVTAKRERSALEDARRRLLHATYLFRDTNIVNPITISSFYSILQPAPPLPSAKADHALQPEAMQATLLPFQRRSLAWLLEREGMSMTADGTIVRQESPSAFTFWTEVKERNYTWYLNRLSGELSHSKPEAPTIYGGMLAEEPGLGKTVEIIALMLSNPAPPNWNPTSSRWDEISRLDVRAVKTTLIVTPPALASQWKDELAKHAPSLKVLVYNGWNTLKVPITAEETPRFLHMKAQESKSESKPPPKKTPKKQSARSKKKAAEKAAAIAEQDMTKDAEGKLLDWCQYVHQFDVVITTYSTLRSDIYVARPGPDRPHREKSSYPAYVRTRSPLVMVEWQRVVMDEVQMVGGGSAAEMVSLVPRLSSFAVSGTPAKSQVSDLLNVFKFLRIDRLIGDLRLWKRLLKPAFSEELTAFLHHYGIRTAKSSVTAELTIPEQTRYLVRVELGKVERHVYDQTLEQILHQLGLDSRGVAATSNWEIDGALLRSSLRRLRGICTHPQVGQLQKKGDGLYKPGALKTMDAVLQTMKDTSWKNVVDDWKAKIQLLIRIAQLQSQDDSIPQHHQNARTTLELAEKETNKYLKELKDELAKHDARGKELKEEAALLRQKQLDEMADDPDTEEHDIKGKGKSRAHTKDDEDSEEDPEEVGLPKNPAGMEHRTKRRALMQRLREGLLLLHRVNFLQGDVHHVLENPELEDASYQAAEGLRRELLKSSEDDANKAVALLTSNAARKNLDISGMLTKLPLLAGGGIRSTDLMNEVNRILEEVLNKQSELLWEWRTHIIGLLSQPLNKKDADADGQEYQKSLDDQGEAEIYLQAYAALLADRREALTNERTLLATHDVREKQFRLTKAAIKAAVTAQDNLDAPEGLDLQPEHEVLHTTLLAQRKEIVLALRSRSIKSITVDLNAVNVKAIGDNDPEKVIAKDAVDILRRFVSVQNSLHDKLESDLTLLRKSFNQRILYFRQLQEISDDVAEVEWEEESATTAIKVAQAEKVDLEAKINTARARHRYIENLSQTRDTTDAEEERECVLCRSEFSRGYFTHCGHIFCELCMKLWLYQKSNKTCPVCRVAIDMDTIQRFATNTRNLTVEPPPNIVAGEAVPQSKRTIEYNRIDPTIFEEIQRMETMGDYGIKVQTLVRHLAHIELTDPGAKSIVFSAWADSLHIVEHALRTNGIQTLRIENGTKNGNAAQRFATDPDLSVLLLHGERENAGLNVTCASRVFLLESVVHHSFELQAIARIDRLGQTRPTEVYCYYAEETIERNILDLAARKGLSLYTKDNSKGTVSISTFTAENEQAIDNAKRKAAPKGDFIYKVDDMLAILFPHMFEELQYLLPPTALEGEGHPNATEDVEMTDNFAIPRPIPRSPVSNAVAGPSRLR